MTIKWNISVLYKHLSKHPYKNYTMINVCTQVNQLMYTFTMQYYTLITLGFTLPRLCITFVPKAKPVRKTGVYFHDAVFIMQLLLSYYCTVPLHASYKRRKGVL